MARQKVNKENEQLVLPLQPLLFPIPKDAVQEPYVDLPDDDELSVLPPT
ncbi:MAG: hypothetical protein GY822_30525 [Deltaproteobacteria bacterium]|nr:hypothetical protein [Deltaproteobacteria bacterium]